MPWPTRPALGLYHHSQAQALAELDVDVRIFSPAPKLPEWTARLGQRFKLQVERPTRYEMNGIVTESPKARFAFPPIVRNKLARIAPWTVAGIAERMIGPALRRVIDRFKPDFILGHGMQPWGTLIQRTAVSRNLKHAFIEHSASDLRRLRRGSNLERFYTECASEAHAIFVPGREMAVRLCDELGWRRVHHLENGLACPPPESWGRPRPQDCIGRDLVLVAAQYARRKGVEELVEAFDQVSKLFPRAMLIIVSDLPPTLQRRVEPMVERGCVRLLPTMLQADLMQWMVWSDLFALPSWQEAFGLVFVEALAAETPVVMSDDCGASDVLRLAGRGEEPDESFHGWSVPPRDVDSLARTLAEALRTPPELRQQMGVSGREYVGSRFSWKRNARALQRILEHGVIDDTMARLDQFDESLVEPQLEG